MSFSSEEKQDRKRMNRLILCAVLTLFLLVTSSNAKSLMNDDDIELNDQNAQMFLRAMLGENSPDLDTRQTDKRCVPCKFNFFLCCTPNLCYHHHFRPDECLEVKTHK